MSKFLVRGYDKSRNSILTITIDAANVVEAHAAFNAEFPSFGILDAKIAA